MKISGDIIIERIVINLILILTFTFSTFAQTIQLNNHLYKKIDGQWYSIYRGHSYKVNNSVITVKFKENVSQSQIINLNQSQGVKILRINILNFYDLKIPSGSDPLIVTQNYINSKLVEIAEPNTFGEFVGEPNDSLFIDQWFHKQPDDHDIDTPEAWDWTTGSNTVIVGILDSGTDYLHEDLKGNIWVNPEEDLDGDGVVGDYGPPSQGGDEDGEDADFNGKLYDLMGWDFYRDRNDIGPYPWPGDYPFTHGTHVAGIIGAITNNQKGVAGVAGGWYPDDGVKILTAKVGETSVDGSIVDDAILYAANEGARIINMSFRIDPSSAIRQAIDTAYNNYDCFLVASSGNDDRNVVYFPANAKHVFAVGATNQNDRRWSESNKGSNYGDSLDVVAPGDSIMSTKVDNPMYFDPPYGYMTGTSMSSAVVAGIAVLLKSYNPSYTNSDIEMIIATSAEKVGGYPYDKIRKYGAWSDSMGYGRVNAYFAVAPPAAPTNLTLTNHNNHPLLQWDANTEPDLDEYWVYRQLIINRIPQSPQRIGIVQPSSNPSYLDENFVIDPDGPADAKYWVKARDTTPQSSGPSNKVSTHGWPGIKIASKEISLNPIPSYSLLQNHPNPFNVSTEIEYSLSEINDVNISIFNILGREVKSFMIKSQESGFHKVMWDGKDDSGREVPSGLYFYKIRAESKESDKAYNSVKKMVFLK